MCASNNLKRLCFYICGYQNLTPSTHLSQQISCTPKSYRQRDGAAKYRCCSLRTSVSCRSGRAISGNQLYPRGRSCRAAQSCTLFPGRSKIMHQALNCLLPDLRLRVFLWSISSCFGNDGWVWEFLNPSARSSF